MKMILVLVTIGLADLAGLRIMKQRWKLQPPERLEPKTHTIAGLRARVQH